MVHTEEPMKKWNKDPQIKKILAERDRLRNTPGRVLDFDGNPGKFDDQLISKAINGSKNHKNGLVLCHLASLHGGSGIVELGTNLGISSAYLTVGARKADARAKIVTGDVSGKRINIAKSVHRNCDLDDIVYVEGLFEVTAKAIFDTVPGWGLAFIDGDHTYEGTLSYYKLALETGAAGSIVIFDDIDWSDGMESAWRMIAANHPDQSQRIDDMGLIYI